MKKFRSLGCLMALILTVLSLQPALAASMGADQGAAAEDSAPAYAGYDVSLEVDGGFLTLRIPEGYQYQPVERTEQESYPYRYTFINEEAGIQFSVFSTLSRQKDQDLFLSKLYDSSNGFILYEDVPIGERAYIVYTNETFPYDYGFLVRTDTGYSYQFSYILPEGSMTDEIPEEAVWILETLTISEASM